MGEDRDERLVRDLGRDVVDALAAKLPACRRTPEREARFAHQQRVQPSDRLLRAPALAREHFEPRSRVGIERPRYRRAAAASPASASSPIRCGFNGVLDTSAAVRSQERKQVVVLRAARRAPARVRREQRHRRDGILPRQPELHVSVELREALVAAELRLVRAERAEKPRRPSLPTRSTHRPPSSSVAPAARLTDWPSMIRAATWPTARNSFCASRSGRGRRRADVRDDEQLQEGSERRPARATNCCSTGVAAHRRRRGGLRAPRRGAGTSGSARG
jgi:hypothetical protein